jgi:uncharacterized membrane protein YidH (DUF202 family)
VFLVVGGLFTLLLLFLNAFTWLRWRRAPRRTSERRTYASFAGVSVALVLFMAVALWANVTSVVDPGRTLSGTPFSPVGDAWLRSGRAQLSPLLQQQIDDRLAWQRPKAVICAVLLVAFVTAAVLLWRTLIRRSAAGVPLPRFGRSAGVLLVVAGVVLMMMVIGNAEAAIAPLTLTVIYG